jgi:hypothetical protein
MIPVLLSSIIRVEFIIARFLIPRLRRSPSFLDDLIAMSDVEWNVVVKKGEGKLFPETSASLLKHISL